MKAKEYIFKLPKTCELNTGGVAKQRAGDKMLRRHVVAAKEQNFDEKLGE